MEDPFLFYHNYGDFNNYNYNVYLNDVLMRPCITLNWSIGINTKFRV